MSNFYSLFKALLPDAPLLVGTVSAVRTGGAYVDLPGGGSVFARGAATVGQTVFVKDDAIQGLAPTLTVVTIEV